MRGALLLAAVAAASAQCPTGSTCCFNVPGKATFDLSNLSGLSIAINDNRNDTADPRVQYVYQYAFSLCSDASPAGTGSTPASACASTTGVDGKTTTGPGPAFQIGTNINACQRLGDHAKPPTTDGSPSQFSLHPYRPGFNVQYTNGDAVAMLPNSSYVYRSITIDFLCATFSGFQPVPGAWYDSVSEVTLGVYRAFVYTQAACPIQCPTGFNNQVCGNKGVCDYDFSKDGQARCFCNKGVSGINCQTQGDKGLPPPKSYGGNVFGGFIGGIILAIAGVVGYYYHKASKSKMSFSEAFRFQWPLGKASGHVRLQAGDKGFYEAHDVAAASATASWMGHDATGYMPPTEA